MRSADRRIIEECNSDDEDDEDDEVEQKPATKEDPPPPQPTKTMLMIAKQDEKSSIIRRSVERLDSQVSNLHQDVATLSHEVRTAIQALQEVTYSQLQMSQHLPARSIPNLQQNGVNSYQELLIRSSSQPADIWQRNGMCESADLMLR